ncbi:MAG TPA: hypothetical protein VH000_00260 [Rhizomicrobium sp.]|nr:hypothetical protein [Rhizomicrobium sp.]
MRWRNSHRKFLLYGAYLGMVCGSPAAGSGIHLVVYKSSRGCEEGWTVPGSMITMARKNMKTRTP